MPGKERDLLDKGKDKRYVRRDDSGQFTKGQVDVGKSLSADDRQPAKSASKAGQGDRGDRPKK